MINSKMEQLGKKSSVIREIFEYAKKRRAEIGDDKVFDFSIGNPSIPAPEAVNEAIRRAEDAASEEMSKITGQMNLGGMGLPGMF